MTVRLSVADAAREMSGRISALSFAQERLWVLNELYPDSHVYNTRTAYTILGELDVRALRSSLGQVVRRHEILRTTFELVDAEPVQIVHDSTEIELPIFDLSHASEEELIERLIYEDNKPFDLRRGPLLRAVLFRRGPLEHVLLFGVHHIVYDEASVSILNTELAEQYAAFTRGKVVDYERAPIQYSEFAAWQRKHVQTEDVLLQSNYWRVQLANAPARIELPLDQPRPAIAGFCGAHKVVVLSATLTERIRALGHAHRTTLFMTMFAAFNVLLYRYTGQSDLIVGSPVSTRSRTEFESIIGLFINTVALRTRLGPDLSFLDVLQQARESAISAYENQDVPFERVIAEIYPERNLNSTPLVNVMFAFSAGSAEPLVLDGLRIERLRIPTTTARFDLTLRVSDTRDGLTCSLQYDTALFTAQTVEALMEHFRILLEGIVSSPKAIHKRISDLPLLAVDERDALFAANNETHAEYPREKTVADLFDEQVRRSPSAVALLSGQSTLTYAQLDESANQLARFISAQGISRGARVGIMLNRSPNLIIGLLAILKLRCVYVGLDPLFPNNRLEFMVEDSQLAAIVTESFRNDPILSESRLLRIDVDSEVVALEGPSQLPYVTGSCDDTAYSIYTSGSTGIPKAVNVPHRALTNLLWSIRERPGLSSRDTFVAITTICFDLSVVELFLPLIVGAKLVIAKDQVAGDGSALLRLLTSCEATVMLATPATWQLILDAGWRGWRLRKILCAGEALSRPLAERLLRRGDELWNLYGPTETTVFSSVERVEHGSGTVSIGTPIANTQFYILDANGELSPPGIPGELFIGGDGVALGYHARNDLTLERFVPDRFRPERRGKLYRTGDVVRKRGAGLEFLGRLDQQVKLRGFRIELGEVVSALREQPSVVDAVAMVIEEPDSGPSLRAYVVKHSSVDVTTNWPSMLRAAVALSLPRYMLPSVITVVEALPRLPNGKLDRRSLASAASSQQSTTRDTLESELESVVYDVASEILGHSQVGPTDDLFNIGLHSMTAVRLVARLEQVVGARLPLQTVFKGPTVRALAREIQSYSAGAENADAMQPVVVINKGGRQTPLFFLHNDGVHHGAYCHRLGIAMGPNQPIFAVAPHGDAGLPRFLSVEEMATDYYRILKELRPAGPYRVGGYCLGGLVAFELARLLVAAGDVVDNLIIINRHAPLLLRFPMYDAAIRRIGSYARLHPAVRLFLMDIVTLAPLISERGPAAAFRFISARLSRNVPAVLREIAELNKKSEDQSFMISRIVSATYHPKRYEGNISLIWSSGDELALIGDPVQGDPTFGWGAVAPNVRVTSISGNHFSPIRERVGELGRVISMLLMR